MSQFPTTCPTCGRPLELIKHHETETVHEIISIESVDYDNERPHVTAKEAVKLVKDIDGTHYFLKCPRGCMGTFSVYATLVPAVSDQNPRRPQDGEAR
jgi:hypothetical protein